MVREALCQKHGCLPTTNLPFLDELGREDVAISVNEADDQGIILLWAHTKRCEWLRLRHRDGML